MLYRHADLPVTRWRNGAGRKADVTGGPGWLITFAWIDGDADFSDFPGQDRTITLVEGDGFRLDFPASPALVVDRPLVPRAFDGGWPARCTLLGAPCMVLNALSDRAGWTHAVEIRAVRPEDTGHAVLLSGGARLPDGSLAARLDTVALPLALPPGVTCAVIRFTPRG